MLFKTRRRKWLTFLLLVVGVATGFIGRLLVISTSTNKPIDLETPRTRPQAIDPAIPAVMPVSSVPLPVVNRFQLKNGLQVLVLENHRQQQVTMRLVLPAGQVYASTSGVAVMTNEMITEGTTAHSAEQIADYLEQQGATVSHTCSREDATLQLTGLSEHTADLLGCLSDMARFARFPENRLARMKQLWVPYGTEFQGAQNLAEGVAAAALYAKTPYAHPSATIQEIQALQTPSLVDFYHQRYRPNQAILAISGDVTTANLRRLVEHDLGQWAPSSDFAAAPSILLDSKERDGPEVSIIDWAYDKQAYVSFQCLTVPRGDPDFFPLLVANRILGSGGTSRLGEDLRENRGFTYGAASNFHAPSHYPGIWCADVTVPVEKVETTIQDIRVQIDRLRSEPVSEEELTHTKNDLIGSYRRLFENPASVLGIAVSVQEAGSPTSLYESYTSHIAAVSRVDIQRVAAKYLSPNRTQIVIVGPRKKLRPVLSVYNTVRNYDARARPLF